MRQFADLLQSTVNRLRLKTAELNFKLVKAEP